MPPLPPQLIVEADELKVRSTEAGALRELVERAQRWRLAARRALEQDEPPEEVVATLLDELNSLPLRLGERMLLKRRLARTHWLLSRREALQAALEPGVKPTLAELRAMVDEALEIDLADLAEVAAARARVDAADDWVAAARKSIDSNAEIGELKRLLSEGDAIELTLEEADELRGRIGDMQDWAGRASAALDATVPPRKLRSLIEQAERAEVRSVPELRALRDKERLARWWQRRVAACFVKHGCKLGLLEALRGDGHYELVGDDGGWIPGLACDYCTGTDPAETTQFMIGCDACERWYHGPCVGVAKAQADAMDEYMCPECAKASGKQYAFGPPIPKVKRTRRPRLRYVTALLGEAEEIGVEMPEIAPLAELGKRASEWQECAAAILEHEAPGSEELEAAATDAIAEAEELEVEPDLLPAWRWRAQQLRAWRKSVAALPEPPKTAPKRGAGGTGSAAAAAASSVTFANNGIDAAATLLLQKPTLPLGENAQPLEGALKETLSKGEQWRASARDALRRGDADGNELQRILDGALVHVSPEVEMLKIAIARRELTSYIRTQSIM